MRGVLLVAFGLECVCLGMLLDIALDMRWTRRQWEREDRERKP